MSVHPHVRGEYEGGTEAELWAYRFTPTCVGNTAAERDDLAAARGSPPRAWGILTCAVAMSDVLPVHPHVRGEYGVPAHRPRAVAGSPPRAWGILGVASGATAGQRFTPTCVGNTAGFTAMHRVPAVHPHVRGEYYLLPRLLLDVFGSPPRAWGIRVKTINRRSDPSVHPHVRGEYFQCAMESYVAYGSPPRAWGIRSSSSISCSSSAVHPHVRGEYD